MKPFRYSITSLFVMVFVAACASTEVSNRETYQGEKLTRPDRMIVHDFTADPAEVPPESAFAGQVTAADPPPTAEQLEASRQLGAEIAKQLVAKLSEAGLPAVHATGQPAPAVNDIVIRGYFASVQEGSAGKRVLVGFGAGGAELVTAAEGYQMTAQGLRLLGSSEIKSASGKTPGLVLPAAVMAATRSPIGLIVGGAAKVAGEAGGSDTIEGAAKRTAEEIAAQIREAAAGQGWI